MNTEQAIAYLEECIQRQNAWCDYTGVKEMRLAIAALREKAERENPKPLTLEQLRERVGKPVWIQKDYGEYKVFKKYHDAHNKYGKRYWFTDKEILFECNYGETWLAYDHEPKESHK